MHSAIRIFTLMSMLSLILGSLTGCGEKRIHVATVSGVPGEETAVLSPTDESAMTEVSGLSESSIDESALLVQDFAADEPINMAHTPSSPSSQTSAPSSQTSAPSSQNGSSDSSPADSLISTQESVSSLPEIPDNTMPAQAFESPENDDSLSPLVEGRDFAAQSSSPSEEYGNHSLAKIEDFQEPTISQYSDPTPAPLSQHPSSEFENIFSGEEAEPVVDVVQIAKAEPSDSLDDRLNRIQQEELTDSAEGLEDVFFQFDSWALTPEGKESLQRTFGWFEQDPSSNLIIAGHADQRGTQAYNMVLAKKRAVAVQDYLSQLGVDPSRMAVISYGKDKPFCQDTTEVCYQLNRRGHLLIPNR